MATEKNITMKQFNGTDYDTLYPKTIASQVDGLSQILVTTHPNTEVTASLNGKTVSAMSDSSGLAVLKVTGYGTWTVTATVDGAFVSRNCEIKAVAQYELTLVPELETTSWDDISAISERGNASSVFSVGDQKHVNIDSVDYLIRIIGFNHDTKTSGGKAGITFQLVNCLNDDNKMNNSNTNNGGWQNCAMRTSTMATLLTKLPSALQNVIKAVQKQTSAGNQSSTISTTSDKLFLLSEVEIFGSITNSKSGEGKQYDYYKAGNPTYQWKDYQHHIWWERSPAKGNNTQFCSVDNDGNPDIENANFTYGVVFAFCV